MPNIFNANIQITKAYTSDPTPTIAPTVTNRNQLSVAWSNLPEVSNLWLINLDQTVYWKIQDSIGSSGSLSYQFIVGYPSYNNVPLTSGSYKVYSRDETQVTHIDVTSTTIDITFTSTITPTVTNGNQLSVVWSDLPKISNLWLINLDQTEYWKIQDSIGSSGSLPYQFIVGYLSYNNVPLTSGSYKVYSRDETQSTHIDVTSTTIDITFTPTITPTVTNGDQLSVVWSDLPKISNLWLINLDQTEYWKIQDSIGSSGSLPYQFIVGYPSYNNVPLTSGSYKVYSRDETQSTHIDVTSTTIDITFTPTITPTVTNGNQLSVVWSNLPKISNLWLINLDQTEYWKIQDSIGSSGSLSYQFIVGYPSYNNVPLTSGSYKVYSRDETQATHIDVTSDPINISFANTGLASQWQTVYDDSITLMKKGLLDDSYHYLLKTQPEAFTNGLTISNNLNATDINILSFSGENMILNDVSGDIGVNNNIYKIQLPQTDLFAFTINSPYITMGGPNIFSPSTETIPLTESNFLDPQTLYIVNNNGDLYTQFMYKASISSKVSDINPNRVIITYIQWTPVIGKVGNPWPTQKKIFVDGIPFLSEGAYNSTDGTTSVIIQSNDSNMIDRIMNGSTIVISSTLTPTITYIQNTNYYYSYTLEGPVTLTISVNAPVDYTDNLVFEIYYIPITYNSTTYTYSLNGNLPGTSVTTRLMPSSTALWVNSFNPPERLLSSLSTVNDIKSITGFSNYLPTILPGNDYTLLPATNDYSLYWSSPSSAVMDSDQCRQPWRLSNYIRSYDEKNQDIIKVALNTANAMYYNGTLPDPDNLNYEISLGINTYDFTSGHGGYSGDMVPPLIALIDALVVNNTITMDETGIYKLVYFIKNLNNNPAEGESTLALMISNLEGKTPNVSNQKVYPILDSRISGGQQLGLAGVGLICTLDFLTRDGYNVMDKYGAIIDWGVYDNSKLFINKSSATTYQQFNDERFNAMIQIYLMQCMRGNGFTPYAEWGNDAGAQNYAKQILNKAYMTNVRIRGINISKVNELAFGPNDQQNSHTIKGNSGDSDTYSYYAAAPSGTFNPQTGEIYVPTYFPIYGIPDQGWGSLTVEIFSYIGVALVGINDYVNFCRWHRMYYFLLFQQNGGDMVGWSDSSTDKIIQKDSTPSIKNKNSNGTVNFWIPEYLTDDKDSDISGDSDNWANDVLNSNPAIHYFDIYKWPFENVVTNGSSSTSDNPTTKYWANRFNPYRGSKGGEDNGVYVNNKVQWSTPSYCMGYSPVWVAGGKTQTTEGWNDTKVNRPVAEALNPHFSNVLGLYSATDGDNNAFIAYTLASLQWPDTPTITDLNFNSINKGYNCDVCDFNESVGKNIEPGGFGDGVLAAVNALHPSGFHGYKNELINLTNCIGYGFKPPNDGQNAVSNWTPITDNSEEHATTWAYIAKSIQRTMISTHGNGFSGNFGNFSPNGYAPTATSTSSRIVTLGHDSSAGEGPIKMDYQDLRIYQICKKMNNL